MHFLKLYNNLITETQKKLIEQVRDSKHTGLNPSFIQINFYKKNFCSFSNNKKYHNTSLTWSNCKQTI